MKKRLYKIYLSKKPEPLNVLMGLLGLLVLVVIHFADVNHLTRFRDLFAASGEQVFGLGEHWRLFTTTLVHADLDHLALNSIAFTLLAVLLNTYFGLLLFPITSLLSGAVINLIVLSFYPPGVTLVGISGVIYFMAAFWLTMYAFIERRISAGKRLINICAMSLIFLFPQGGILEERVSYASHAVGFVLGVLFALGYQWRMKEKFLAAEVWVDDPPDVDDELLDFLSQNHEFMTEDDQKYYYH